MRGQAGSRRGAASAAMVSSINRSTQVMSGPSALAPPRHGLTWSGHPVFASDKIHHGGHGDHGEGFEVLALSVLSVSSVVKFFSRKRQASNLTPGLHGALPGPCGTGCGCPASG